MENHPTAPPGLEAWAKPERNEGASAERSAGQQEANAALAALAASGNAFALGQLWEINKGLLRSLFWRWYPAHKALADAHGMTADDFEQEGYFAVQYAAQTYQPEAGSFSNWLGQAMQRQINQALTGGHRRSVTDADGKQHTVSANPLNHCASLDTPLDDEDSGAATLGELQPDPAAASAMQAAEDAIFQEQLHAALEEALHKLTEREQAVIRGKYYAGKTVRQISEEQGLTIGQVNTAKTSAFSKLRRNPRLMRWREETLQRHAWHGTGFSAWYAGGSVEERTVEYLESRGAYSMEEAQP
ncbi:MAG TPA: sigma-70 family RNA polymerase sigma factor [Candidatus Gemmiger excrementavium]|uniref:Sigma-70 family RNA polymerase sigma factor n=1 Tax=Candidatus Gemmiger excrementavium TaxID=2838608 RepID=A0A9D2JG11_9FIRM|nr:sigma-70 family RNA polymerase sigma factor [Candidatus Gemmiger excrementavium]